MLVVLFSREDAIRLFKEKREEEMIDHGRPGARKDRRSLMLIGIVLAAGAIAAFGAAAYQHDQEEITRQDNVTPYYGTSTESLMHAEGVRTHLSPG